MIFLPENWFKLTVSPLCDLPVNAGALSPALSCVDILFVFFAQYTDLLIICLVKFFDLSQISKSQCDFD
jgi:hypothetical protein